MGCDGYVGKEYPTIILHCYTCGGIIEDMNVHEDCRSDDGNLPVDIEIDGFQKR